MIDIFTNFDKYFESVVNGIQKKNPVVYNSGIIGFSIQQDFLNWTPIDKAVENCISLTEKIKGEG